MHWIFPVTTYFPVSTKLACYVIIVVWSPFIMFSTCLELNLHHFSCAPGACVHKKLFFKLENLIYHTSTFLWLLLTISSNPKRKTSERHTSGYCVFIRIIFLYNISLICIKRLIMYAWMDMNACYCSQYYLRLSKFFSQRRQQCYIKNMGSTTIHAEERNKQLQKEIVVHLRFACWITSLHSPNMFSFWV